MIFTLNSIQTLGPVRIPRAISIDLPAGTMEIWPMNLELGTGVRLRSATAQPVCRFSAQGVSWQVFSQMSTVVSGFAFAAGIQRLYIGRHGERVSTGGVLEVIWLDLGHDAVVEIAAKNGSKIGLLLLSEADAGWLAQLHTASERLLASEVLGPLRISSISQSTPARQ